MNNFSLLPLVPPDYTQQGQVVHDPGRAPAEYFGMSVQAERANKNMCLRLEKPLCWNSSDFSLAGRIMIDFYFLQENQLRIRK